MILEQLENASDFHTVINRTPDGFQIVPANQNDDCLEGFHRMVVDAIKHAPVAGYEIKGHSSDIDPKGRYDLATITLPHVLLGTTRM